MQRGQLIIVIGPEGGGKRRLLSYARSHALECARAIFPRRYVTGLTASTPEEVYRLDERTFSEWIERGLFALHWTDGACRYGIGREIDSWMDAGLNVVLPGDETALAKARTRYPDLDVLLVTPGADRSEDWTARDPGLNAAAFAEEAARLERVFEHSPVIRTENSMADAARQLSRVLQGRSAGQAA